MRGRKNLALILMSLLLAFVLVIPAFASNESGATEVKKISLKVSQSSKGRITGVIPREEGYTVSYDTNESDADAGDNPKAYVTVTAKEGYVFLKDFDKSSHFSISGGKFEEGERISQTSVYVEISCKTKVHDTLETPTELSWSEDWGLATWEDVDGADYYKVKVNGTEIGNIYQNYIDLSGYIKYKKKNTFQVRAYSNSSYTKASSWSEKSDELYFDDWDDWNDRYDNYDYNDYNYGGISSKPGGYYGGTNNSGVRNDWVKRDGVWYYYDGNGYTLKNGMYRIRDKYYLFDSEGRMKTGWQKSNGNYYYFDEVNGDAVSGWKMINGSWNYFKEGKRVENTYIYENGKTYYVVMNMISNDWHDGRYFKNGQAYNGRQYNGEMLTNTWDYIKGNWYYFDNNGYAVKNGVAQINGSTYKFASDGKLLTGGWFDYNGASYYTKPDGTMARNEWINGYYVDGNGRWIR